MRILESIKRNVLVAWYFGMKGHIGVDSRLIHSVTYSYWGLDPGLGRLLTQARVVIHAPRAQTSQSAWTSLALKRIFGVNANRLFGLRKHGAPIIATNILANRSCRTFRLSALASLISLHGQRLSHHSPLWRPCHRIPAIGQALSFRGSRLSASPNEPGTLSMTPLSGSDLE